MRNELRCIDGRWPAGFLIGQDETILRISERRFKLFDKRDPTGALLELVNKPARFVLAFIDIENRKPRRLRGLSFPVIHVDASGLPDLKQRGESQRLVSTVLSEALRSEADDRPRGADRFALKRVGEEFQWQPSSQLQQKITDQISAEFGG